VRQEVVAEGRLWGIMRLWSQGKNPNLSSEAVKSW